jgi:hypothetical protein
MGGILLGSQPWLSNVCLTESLAHMSLVNFSGTTIEGVWTAPANDIAVENILVSIGTEFQTVGTQRGTFLPFQYMNDAAANQDPLRSYGAAKLQRLTSISEKYDPARVFQILQYDGFLVSKA